MSKLSCVLKILAKFLILKENFAFAGLLFSHDIDGAVKEKV